jgi:uncharacterized membrane protein YGL010W
MKSINDQMRSYTAYHHDERNKATHFIGVPLVTLGLLVSLGWLRFLEEPLPVTGATLFYVAVSIYYFALDWRVALLQAPFTLILLAAADVVSRWPWPESLATFGVTFGGGWIIQLVGHWFEGKRPALADNVLQIFNAPLFLVVEVLLALGFRQELHDSLSERESPHLKAARDKVGN